MGKSISSSLAALYCVLFFCLAGIFGLVSTVTAYENTGTPDRTTFLNGKWALAFEKSLSQSLPFYDSARHIVGDVDYKLFGEGRKGVVVGIDGWLFSGEEFQTSRFDEEIYKGHLDFVRKTAALLEQKNIKVLIAVIPSKARMKQDMVSFPSRKKPFLERFIRDLGKSHVESLNLSPALGGKGFLKTDTHWSPAGASASARMIARILKPACRNCTDTYKNTVEKTVPYRGDLLKYIPVSDINLLTADMIDHYKTASLKAPDLFGDETPKITLVGTSYSAKDDFNFENFLKEYLNSDVLNMAEEGKGPFTAMKDFLNLNLPAPQILIWEIPERYFTMADR